MRALNIKRMIILSVLVILTTVISSYMPRLVSRADEMPSNIELLTSSLVHDNISLMDYVDEFYGNGVSFNPVIPYTTDVHMGTLIGNNAYIYNANDVYVHAHGDDNIVKFIPKELFCTQGYKLYIGTAYGFAINTKQNNAQNGSYLSSVVIFQTNGIWVGNKYKLRLTTLAKIDYCYIHQFGSFDLYDKNGDYVNNWSLVVSTVSGITNVVVPRLCVDKIDSFYKRPVVCLAESKHISVENISMSSNVYNQNSLNTWDNEYNVEDDNGYFLIDNDYEYSATVQNGGNNIDIATIVSQAGDFALGTLLGEAVPFLGNLYSLTSSIVSIANCFTGIQNAHITNVSATGCGTALTESWTTKDEQMDNYGRLIKAASIIFNDAQYNLKYEKNDFFEAQYTYSHPNGVYLYTRINFSIAAILRCKKYENSTYQYISSPVVNEIDLYEEINVPESYEYPTLWFQNTREYYMTPSANMSCAFTAPYNGTYILHVNGSVGAVKVNGNIITGNNGFYSFEGASNNKYSIILGNNGSTCRGVISIDVADSTSSFASNETRLVKYNLSSGGLKHWSTTNSNVSVTDIMVSNSNILTSYTCATGVVLTTVTNSTMPISAGVYYVLLHNNASTACTADVNVDENVQVLTQNWPLSLDLTNKYTFVRFNASTWGDYTLSNASLQTPSAEYRYVVINEDLSLRSCNASVSSVSMSSVEGVMYIGIKTYGYPAYAVNTTIIKEPDLYQWKVNNVFLNANSIELARNNKHALSLFKNGVEYSSLEISTGNTYVNKDVGSIDIDFAMPEGDAFVVYAYNNANALLPYALSVLVTRDDKFSLSAINTQTVAGFQWDIKYANTGISQINYTLTDDAGHSYASNVTMSPGVMQGEVNVCSMSGLYRWTCATITSYVCNGQTRYYSDTVCNVAIDNWYNGGSGIASDPYRISCPRHFNNIVKNRSAYYIQTANLNFNNTASTRGVNFSGIYNGNGKSITNIRVNMSGYTVAYVGGLFDRNSGSITGIPLYTAYVNVNGITNNTVAVGGMVGYNLNGAMLGVVLATCTVASDSRNNNSAVGGIVGYNCGTLGVVFATDMTITGYCNQGGLVGKNGGAIDIAGVDCSIVFTRTSAAPNCAIGGIAGYNSGSIELTVSCNASIDCNNESGNKTNRPRVGLLVGENDGGSLTYDATITGTITADDIIPVCQLFINFNGPIGYNH